LHKGIEHRLQIERCTDDLQYLRSRRLLLQRFVQLARSVGELFLQQRIAFDLERVLAQWDALAPPFCGVAL
jgi:hypothetical protein